MNQMTAFVVTGFAATVSQGRVRLTMDQSRPRLHNLAAVAGEEGVFEVLRPLCFKCGERFEYDGTFPKAMAEAVATEGSAAAKAAQEGGRTPPRPAAPKPPASKKRGGA